MPISSADRELFPLSWLSQYGYCPRRCGLLAIEQTWAENADTASGRLQHQRVHTARSERRGDQIFLYEYSVFSRELGVNGKCDCIELHPDANGVALPFGPDQYRIYPIEYKHGKLRLAEEEYHIQLCAQALCLEEQFGCFIPAGAIFYTDAHRRFEVELTEPLRRKTRETAASVARLLEAQQLPAAKYSGKCRRCSMEEICQPRLKSSAASYCQELWNMLQREEDP